MKKLAYFFVLLILVFPAMPALAAIAATEEELLYFGQAIIGGTTVQSILVSANGVTTLDPDPGDITILVPGRNGVYRLSGFAPSTSLSVSFNATTLSGPGGLQFDISNFVFDPPCTIPDPCSTDASGNMILKVGAKMSTRASTVYSIAPHRGTYTLTITY